MAQTERIMAAGKAGGLNVNFHAAEMGAKLGALGMR